MYTHASSKFTAWRSKSLSETTEAVLVSVV